MASGRAAFGIGDYVTGISHLEARVGDPESCARALAPLGLAVVGRRPAGDSPPSVAVAAGDARLVLTQGGAGTVTDVALLVGEVEVAEQVAMARGALPAPRARRTGRATPGPAIGGAHELIHSLVAVGDWLQRFDPVPSAPSRASPLALGRIRIAVPVDEVGTWQDYYADVLGGREAQDRLADRDGSVHAGATRLEVAAATRPGAGVEEVELAAAERLATIRTALDDAGVAHRRIASTGALELLDAGELLGVRLLASA